MTTQRYFLVLHLICNARRSINKTKPIELVSEIRFIMYNIAMEETTVGDENSYIELIESKQTDDAETYDDVAPDKGGTPSTEPAQSCAQENFLRLQRMLHIVTAVAIISLLTATASLALALIVMNSQNTKDSVRCPADCVNNAAVQGT